MLLSEEEHIRKMIRYFQEMSIESIEGKVSSGRIKSDTNDENFNRAVRDIDESIKILESKFNQFEEDLENGKYDEYLDDDGNVI